MSQNKAIAPTGFKAFLSRVLGLGPEYYRDWADIFGRQSEAGVGVDAEKVLTLSTVWACTRIISQTIATLPLELYEKRPSGAPVLSSLNDIRRIIQVSPNADVLPGVFWESLIGNAVLRGNGFAEKLRVGERVVALQSLHPDRLRWDYLPGTRTLRFVYTEIDGTVREIPTANIFHLPGFTLYGPFGMSVIRYGVEVFGAALAAGTAANSTFKNGLLPTTYFKMDRVLKGQQRDDFRTNLAKISGALNAGKSPLLEGGMDIGHVGINPDDAQLLESRVFSVEEVCRWFQVPPSMVGSNDKSSSWASSAENLNLWFLKYCLMPWCKRVTDAISKSLLSPAESVNNFARYSFDGLLMADTAARREFYASALQNGWMNRDEVRQAENRQPIKGGDVYTIQTSMAELKESAPAAEETPVLSDASATGTPDVQATALNGAQVTSLQEIVLAVAQGKLPAETARAMISAAFPLLTAAQVAAMIGPLAGFQPTADTPPPPPAPQE